MKTDEYLRQLSKYLKKLPKADYDDAMEYFTEYFAETDENEAKKLMDELGTPKEAACDIISNILEKKIDEKKQADSEKEQLDSDKKSVFGVLWIALLAIFALPVATPLLISSLIVMFCVLLCVLLAVLCVFLLGVCAAIAGMAVIARAIVTVKLSISSAIMLSGLGLAAIGVGIIIVLLGVLCVRLFAELTIKFDRKEIECMDISKLKKQIKHCKNLLERKARERQLNKAYKVRKAKKCVSEHKTEEC